MLTTHNNVALPKRRRPSNGARLHYPFATMEIGKFFFIPNKTKNNFAPHACVMGQKLNRKFATRLTTMMEQIDGWVEVPANHPYAVKGIGVWRTK